MSEAQKVMRNDSLRFIPKPPAGIVSNVAPPAKPVTNSLLGMKILVSKHAVEGRLLPHPLEANTYYCGQETFENIIKTYSSSGISNFGGMEYFAKDIDDPTPKSPSE